jgi:ABC-type oligopeptide transport system substrate-binding subunit
MKTSKWLMGTVGCLALVCVCLTGCDEESNPFGTHEEADIETGEVNTFANDEDLAAAWSDITTGLVTTLNPNGTYTVSSAAMTIQTGTWTTSGNQITFTPQGDVPATMTYSISGSTMTIVDDGVATVFTR